jgi:hypothetical protein
MTVYLARRLSIEQVFEVNLTLGVLAERLVGQLDCGAAVIAGREIRDETGTILATVERAWEEQPAKPPSWACGVETAPKDG